MPDPTPPSMLLEGTLLRTFRPDDLFTYETVSIERDHKGLLPSPGDGFRLAHVVPLMTPNGGTARLMLFWERALPNDPPDPGKPSATTIGQAITVEGADVGKVVRTPEEAPPPAPVDDEDDDDPEFRPPGPGNSGS